MLELFLLVFFSAIVVAFALGLMFESAQALGLGCAFAASWYMAIGGITIIAAAADPDRLIAVATWFTFYGVIAALVVFLAGVLGTLAGVVYRAVARASSRGGASG